MSHQLAFFAAWPCLLWLLREARTSERALYGAVYALSLLCLLGVSALYHRRTWTPVGRARMRLLDHSVVFLLIAGTYTPLTLLAVGGLRGALLCAVIWLGALLGIGQTLFWPTAPRALHVGLYVVLGWAGAFGLAGERATLGSSWMVIHLLSGVVYTLGALTYARKRPDPYPRVFGYHEIFHLLVLVACGGLFAVVWRCLTY